MLGSSHRLDRRDFLKRVAAVGASAAGPAGLLAACGGDERDPALAQEERERHDLHFDFSAADIAEPRLFLLRSTSHNQALLRHDDASRARHRAANPALKDVPDERLTHYIEQVDLPARALQGVLAMGRHVVDGRRVLAAAQVFVPDAARDSVARRAAHRARTSSSKDRARADATRGDLKDLIRPTDIAAYLVFHHPEVMNLNAELGAEILDRIENFPCDASDTACLKTIGTLAFQIAAMTAAHGYPSTLPGSWATLIPMVDLDGHAVVDETGEPVYRYDLHDEIAVATGEVVKVILRGIFDDPLFEGTNWHATSGIATQAGAASSAPRAAAATESFGIAAAHPVGSTIAGVRMVGLEVTDPASREITLTIRNDYLRFVSVYVQFRDGNVDNDPDGELLSVEDPGQMDTTYSQYVTMAPSNAQIMGIPFQGDQVESTSIRFTMPTAAASATVLLASLGLGGDAFGKEAVLGSSLTLAVNIGLPTMLLAMGVVCDATLAKGVGSVCFGYGGSSTLKTILAALLRALAGAGVDLESSIIVSAEENSLTRWISGVANALIQALLDAAPAILVDLFTETAVQLGAAFGPLGIALKVMAVLASAAQIAVTVGEVLASPAVATNRISLTMDTTVRLAHDPRDFQFPAAARSWTALAYYDGGAVPRSLSGTIDPGRVEPIDIVFSGVPSGGQVKFVVSLYSDQDCLVGIAQSQLIDNLPDTASLVSLTLVEQLAALTFRTLYEHSLKLGWDQGEHRWVKTSASTRTLSDLCAGQDARLCELTGLAVHTASGMAGYGFSAGGSATCPGGDSGDYQARGIFLGAHPDAGSRALDCGRSQPLAVAFDPVGAAADGRHFLIEPGNGFHLRRISLDGSGTWVGGTRSWGRFNNAPDSVVMLPSGYVISVSRDKHKMEVLLLPQRAVDQAVEPEAVPYATQKSGQGTRAGLLDTPVAVAARGAAVLVLEQGNKRVQALDAHANPVKLFDNGLSSIMGLLPEDSGTYLDLAVEGQGYLYVLSYVGNGTQASQYRLDLYAPTGQYLTRTVGVAAARIAVDLFRNLYTLNYEAVAGAPTVEPSLSQWLPVTPGACSSTSAAALLLREGATASCAMTTRPEVSA